MSTRSATHHVRAGVRPEEERPPCRATLRTRGPDGAGPYISQRSSAAGLRADGVERWLHDGLADLDADSRILALGCDEAFFAPRLLDYAAEVTVLDTSGGQIAQLARRFPEIAFRPHHPAQPLPFAARSFDVVCCCEFLDRVFNPVATLREIHRVLAAGGRLLVSVPDQGAVRKMLHAILPKRNDFGAATPRLHAFTRRALGKLAREAGFRDVQIGTFAAGFASAVAPRRIGLQARKGPELACALVEPRSDAAAGDWALHEELAFAGRSRAL